MSIRALLVALVAGGGAALCCATPNSSPRLPRTQTIAGSNGRSDGRPTFSPYWHVSGEGWGRPAADSTAAYFLSKDRRLIAIDAETGRIRWQCDTGTREPSQTPSGSRILLADQEVIVGDAVVLAFDRTTGAPLWHFSPPDGYGAGTYLGQAIGGRIYTGSPAGRVFAIDAKTGVSRWTAVVADDRRTVVFEPVVDDDLVVAGFATSTTPNSGGIVGLDARTGDVRWLSSFPQSSNRALGTSSTGNPLLVDDVVLAASATGVIYAFDRGDGSIRWSLPKVSGLPADYPMSPDFDFRPLARTGRTLFAGSLTGVLIAYDLDTRREIWRFAGPPFISVAFNLTSDERSVYIPYLGGRLVALDASTGTERWRTPEAAGAFSFPVVTTADRVYAASSASGFYALRR